MVPGPQVSGERCVDHTHVQWGLAQVELVLLTASSGVVQHTAEYVGADVRRTAALVTQ